MRAVCTGQGTRWLTPEMPRSLSDLLLLDGTQQNEAVETVRTAARTATRGGTDSPTAQLALDSTQRADFLEFLGAMPCVTVSATCETEVRHGGRAV